jgi:hypothetical protein
VLLYGKILRLFSFVLVRVAYAHEVDIEREGSSLALTYTVPIMATASVEQSADLISWSAIDTFDSILSHGPAAKIIKSNVDVPPNVARLFLRLRLDEAWKVALTWNPSPSPDVSGYCLHYGTSPGNYSRHLDVGNTIQAAVRLPFEVKTCYFVVTAYNTLGIQSFPSRELKVRLRAKPKNRNPGH